MKILKKNQLIILVISLMLVTAGYLNFTTTDNNQSSVNTVAELGDATLVSSNDVENQNNIVENTEEDYEKESNETVENNEVASSETSSVENETQTTAQEDTYFTTSKLERENIYSQMLETYQKVIDTENSLQSQRQSPTEQISRRNNIKYS